MFIAPSVPGVGDQNKLWYARCVCADIGEVYAKFKHSKNIH